MRRSKLTMGVLAAAFALNGCNDSATPVAPGATYSIDRSSFTQFQFTIVPRLFCLNPGDVRTMELARGRRGKLSVAFSRVTQEYCGGTAEAAFGPSRELTAEEEQAIRTMFRRVEIESALPSCDGWQPIWDGQAQWGDGHVYDRNCTVDHLSSQAFGALYSLVGTLVSPVEPPNSALHAPVAGVGQR